MNIGEILIWESSNLLLLIPVVIGLVMLVRWLQGRAVFTERDWLLQHLIGNASREHVAGDVPSRSGKGQHGQRQKYEGCD
jgi:hypothetical protein